MSKTSILSETFTSLRCGFSGSCWSLHSPVRRYTRPGNPRLSGKTLFLASDEVPVLVSAEGRTLRGCLRSSTGILPVSITGASARAGRAKMALRLMGKMPMLRQNRLLKHPLSEDVTGRQGTGCADELSEAQGSRNRTSDGPAREISSRCCWGWKSTGAESLAACPARHRIVTAAGFCSTPESRT